MGKKKSKKGAQGGTNKKDRSAFLGDKKSGVIPQYLSSKAHIQNNNYARGVRFRSGASRRKGV